MITDTQSQTFANEWIDSWNAHDLDRILKHYSDNIEFSSPFIIKLFNEPSGKIKSKEKLKPYFEKGLLAYPNLKFELLHVLKGVNSITLLYRSVNNLLAAEVMILDNQGKISKVLAHYK